MYVADDVWKLQLMLKLKLKLKLKFKWNTDAQDGYL